MTDLTYPWVSSTSMQELLLQMNSYSNDLWGLLMTLAIFIFMVVMSGADNLFGQNLSIISFMTMMFSWLLWMVGLVAIWVPLLYFMIMVAGIFINLRK